MENFKFDGLGEHIFDRFILMKLPSVSRETWNKSYLVDCSEYAQEFSTFAVYVCLLAFASALYSFLRRKCTHLFKS